MTFEFDGMSTAKCNNCGRSVVPSEVAHDLAGGHWPESAPTGWSHSPDEVSSPFNDHVAHPHDNRSLESERHNTQKFGEAWDDHAMDLQVQKIMGNKNLSPEQFKSKEG